MKPLVTAVMLAAGLLLWVEYAAAGGWYLMTPRDLIFVDRPFWGWLIMSSFESVQECEAEKARRIAHARNVLDDPNFEKIPDRATRDAWRARPFAVCVSTDDPRLAPR